MILKLSSEPNRRRQHRQLLNTSVQVFAGSIHVEALGINLSDVGMCLFAIANLPVGSEIEVEFLSPRGRQRVRLCGTVRHRALYLYGIEFQADREQPQGSWVDASTASR